MVKLQPLSSPLSCLPANPLANPQSLTYDLALCLHCCCLAAALTTPDAPISNEDASQLYYAALEATVGGLPQQHLARYRGTLTPEGVLKVRAMCAAAGRCIATCDDCFCLAQAGLVCVLYQLVQGRADGNHGA